MIVPGPLSLVAFDAADWTRAISPAVTVVAQPSFQRSFEAARMLIERIGGAGQSGVTDLGLRIPQDPIASRLPN